MLDKLIATLAFLAFSAVMFIAGAVMNHYELPPAGIVKEALQGGEAWWEQYTAGKASYTERQTQPSSSRRETPPQSGYEYAETPGGYILLCRQFSTTAELIDAKGKIRHEWRMPFQKAWPQPEHVHNFVKARVFFDKCHVYPNGDLLVQYTGKGDTTYGYGMVKMDKHSNVIWKYAGNAHHDFYIDKHNDNIFAITHEIVKTSPNDIKGLVFPMLVDFIVELNPQGEEINKLSVLEAFHNSDYMHLLYQRRKGPKRFSWDHLHTNSIMKLEPGMAAKFPGFKAGQILLSLRDINTLAIIDMGKKEVVWAMTGYWEMQHDAKFLPDGTIALFDNSGLAWNQKPYSRALIIDPASGKHVWSYASTSRPPFVSLFHGRIQPLPNGNMLVTSSLQRRVFEVTRDKEIIWEYRSPPEEKEPILSALRYEKHELPFLNAADD